jgi:predicted amidohydrolase YtcJ
VSESALRSAGVTGRGGDPDGGVIRRAADGTPSGVLHETAARLLSEHIPPPTADVIAAALPALSRACLGLGIVGVHDPASLQADPRLERAFAAYRRLDEAGELHLRVHASVREESLELAGELGLRSGAPASTADDPRLHVGWLKLFADGTVGSRTAALLAPLQVEPDRPVAAALERGVWFTPPERLRELVARAATLGIASQIHAIGDAAGRAALDALETTSGKVPLMPRLEHVQLLDPADRGRFGRAAIAASVQPVHLRSDAATARRTWGARAEANGYPLRSLLDAGAVLAFGTDAPVEPIDPWPGIAIAIRRSDPSWGSDVPPFGPAEALTLAQALRAACLGPSITAREADRGRLTPGCRADLTVLPAAPGEVFEEARAGAVRVRPRLTLVGGEVAFEA